MNLILIITVKAFLYCSTSLMM